MRERSDLLLLSVWGERACFTRPEMKVERVSYDVMTPAAARGVLEAVLWKPEMRWVVERIDVLKPVRWDQVRRNEVSEKASASRHGIDIESVRQQRASLVLRDVAYVVAARIALTDKAGPGDTLAKFAEMFRRRARRGQCFQRPYLGTREFAADFAFVDGEPPTPIEESPDLGWMFHDFDFSKSPPAPRFFKAALDHGSLHIPPPDSIEVRG
jgi:CRISPR-associated protein Cas5d